MRVTNMAQKPMGADLILYQDGRVLMQHRDDNPAIMLPGMWAFFGGRAEAGETPEQAARREMLEELDLELEGELSLVFHGEVEGFDTYVFAAPLQVPLEALTLH